MRSRAAVSTWGASAGNGDLARPREAQSGLAPRRGSSRKRALESATAAGWPAGMRTSEPAATEGFSNFRVGAGAAPQRCAAWILQRAAAGSQRFHVGEARPPRARAAILLPAMTFENPG